MANETNSVGGAATNRGIWFQALWIVLQGAASRLGTSVTSSSSVPDDVLRLVLEPNGGDVRIEYQNSKRIVQLKVKSKGTWALKDVVTEVLPDLYRAVDIGDGKATYEFVTEGRLGDWRAALTFFNGLGGRLDGNNFNDSYARLSAVNKVRFGHHVGDFWDAADDTEKGLFDRIVTVLRGPEPEKGKADDRESLDAVRRKVWHLLTRFRFSGGHSPESVRRDVEQALMRVVSHREEVPQLCDAMGGWISHRSSTNNNAITPAELFAAHGLDKAVPIGDLLVLRRRCREKLMRQLDGLGYVPGWDVRRSPDGTTDHVSTTITAVTGGSGEGKSWRVYAAADVAQTPATTLLESSGDIVRDLQQAAADVWQGALGHDAAKPLANIAQHLRDVLGPACADPWLTICLDRVEHVAAANTLLLEPLEEWGVRIVVGCDPHVAARFEQQAENDANRIAVRRVGEFSTDELHRYLRLRLGDGYAHVPADIRHVLRNPQLAGLYCEVAASPAQLDAHVLRDTWCPRNEYELIDQFWDRLDGPQVQPGSTDALRLRLVAGEVLDGGTYPWTIDQLDAAKLSQEAIRRLIRLGWLRHTADRGRYEVPHDRLLGHAVARALIDRCGSEGLAASAVADALVGVHDGPHQRRLGYLLMDWFHLASRDAHLRQLAQEVLRLYGEKGDHHYREHLHHRLLPTLGSAAVPLLLERLREVAETAYLHEVDPIVAGLADALSESGSEATRDTVLALLNDGRPRVKRAGIRLMALKPVPEGLDTAWRLHQEMQANPTTFAGEHAYPQMLYRDSFGALRAATRLSPAWLDSAIRNADSSVEPVADLAYLVANLHDGGRLWHARKGDLFNKVPLGGARSLATNIGMWRDVSEAGRLDEWARTDRTADRDLVAPAAVQAMARIDPKHAAMVLPQMSAATRYFCRGWFLPRLLVAAGDETREALFKAISCSDDPLSESLVYAGNANDMDARTLNLLLDVLDKRLADLLASNQTGEQTGVSLMQFNLLAEIGRADLLDVFARRAGTTVQSHLAEYLVRIIGPQRGQCRNNPEREPALTVLLRVSGDAFCQVLRAYVTDADVWAKFDAVEWARWYADGALLATVTAAASAEYPAEVDPRLLRCEAARVLAGHGDMAGLLRLGRVVGTQLPLDLPEWIPEQAADQTELPTEALGCVRTEDGAVLHGSLLVLGLARLDGALDEALRVLESNNDEMTRIAAIAAIGLSGCQDEQVIAAIAAYLRDNRLRFATVRALGRIRGRLADAELVASLSYAWDDQLAVFLADNTEHKRQIVPELAQRISRGTAQRRPSSIVSDTLDVVLGSATDELLGDVLRICDTSVHDHLREAAIGLEGSSWVVGSKRDAIRGLSFVDPDAARIAASVTLQSRESRDRSLYPVILYRIDPRAARELFLSLASDEPDDAVLASMAYALAPTADAEWLCRCLGASQDLTRIAACRLSAGPCGDDPAVEERLRSTIDGSSAEVADAAVSALRHVHRQRQAESLIAALPIDAPQARVAAIVQGAIAVGDPGFEGGAWPGWTKLLFKSASIRRFPSVIHVAEDEMKQSRKKAADKAKTDAKRR